MRTVAGRCRSLGLWWGDAVFEPAGVVVLGGRRRRRPTMESSSA